MKSLGFSQLTRWTITMLFMYNRHDSYSPHFALPRNAESLPDLRYGVDTRLKPGDSTGEIYIFVIVSGSARRIQL
jgi:hypothetical protein